MDFSLREDDRRGYEQARLFAERELNHDLAARAAAGELPRALWAACARFGVQGMGIPAAYGGLGLDARAAAAALEGLGCGCRDNGLLMALGAQMWSVVPPLLAFAGEAQKQRWLPRLAAGDTIAAFALTEAESGSDAFALRTVAEPAPGGFVLCGAKLFVTNAPLADLFLVFARTGPGGYFGITAFLVPRDAAGLAVGPALQKMGLETSPMASLQLDQVFVPADACLGELGGGGAVLNATLEWERGMLLAPALGTMDRLLRATVDHCRARRQFGRPIAQFEAVAHQLADLRLRLELSRLLLHRFAWLKDQNLPAAAESAMVKLYVSESLRLCSATALHLHGAYAYCRDFEFERVWRDAMASSIYSGTTEMQKNLIAESLWRDAGRAREESAA